MSDPMTDSASETRQNVVSLSAAELESWSWNEQLDLTRLLEHADGAKLAFVSGGNDPFGVSPELPTFDLESGSFVELECCFDRPTEVQVFWRGAGGFEEAASVRLAAPVGTAPRVVRAPIPQSGLCNSVRQLRIDPSEAPGSGYVRQIRIVREIDPARAAWQALSVEVRDRVSLDDYRQFIHGKTWMYELELAPGLSTPVHYDELKGVHEIRHRLLQRALDERIGPSAGGLSCLDVACNEGFFAMSMLERGFDRVRAVDIRPENVERARFVQRVLGISPVRLELAVRDLYDLDPASEGQFDVSLFYGILYHVEDPIGALRILRRMTRRLAVLETQLTRQSEPLVSGFGRSGQAFEHPASFALRNEGDTRGNPLAAAEDRLSLIPNHAAVVESLKAVGFSEVQRLDPGPDAPEQYRIFDRAVYVAV